MELNSDLREDRPAINCLNGWHGLDICS